MILLVALGTVGVAAFQPGLVSVGAGLLGLRSNEDAENAPAENGENYDDAYCEGDDHDPILPIRNESPGFAQTNFHAPPSSFDSPEQTLPEIAAEQRIPRYEDPDVEPSADFADLTAPLTTELAATQPVPAAEVEENIPDFSAFSQNLTQDSTPPQPQAATPADLLAVVPIIVPSAAPAPVERRSIAAPSADSAPEETVLYDPAQLAQNDSPVPLAAPSNAAPNFIAAPPLNPTAGTEPVEAKNKSIAAPPKEDFKLVSNNAPRNPLAPEEQSNPQYPPQPREPLAQDSRLQVDANLVEIVPCPGAETVARVGTEVILGCDILPEAKKVAYFEIKNKLKELSPEERSQVTPEQIQEEQEMIVQQVFPMILDQYVRFTLLYCDFATSGGRKREDIQMWEKRFGDSFEETELPQLMKRFEVGNRLELNNALEKLIGSSIDREKALFVRKTFGQVMISGAIKEAEGECTHEEMLNYYNDHQAEFFHKARAKWLQLTVAVTSTLPKEKARDKIVWMGNQIAGGIKFERVARDHSDGLTAKNGGFNDWVAKGSLVSDSLEKAVFEGTVGKMSPILEDRNAFHIVLVLEREDEYYTPFLKAQSDIKKKIKELRRNKKEAEYFVELFRKFQPETYQNNVSNFSKPETKTALPQGTGISLHGR